MAGTFIIVRDVKKATQKEQQKMELVILSDLAPKDHLLRKISNAIEFDFIYDKVKDLYCADNRVDGSDGKVYIANCSAIRI